VILRLPTLSKASDIGALLPHRWAASLDRRLNPLLKVAVPFKRRFHKDCWKTLKRVPTDRATAELEERFVNISATFEANT
jgi:hypothetical protein